MNLSSRTHVSSRRHMSWPGLSSGNVFARPCAFATFRDDTCLCPTCLREVSSHSHVSSRRHVSALDRSSGRVFARPRVFVTTRAFVQPVFGRYLLTQTWLHSLKCLGQRSVLRKFLRTPMLFAPRRVSAEKVSSDPHVLYLRSATRASSPSMCLLTPRCLRRPFLRATVLNSMHLKSVSSVEIRPPPRPEEAGTAG